MRIGYAILAIHNASAEETHAGFSFSARETGAGTPARAGMFLGVSGDAILVGGGLDAQGQPSSEVIVTTGKGANAPVTLLVAGPVAYAGYVSAGLPGEKGVNAIKLVLVGGLGASGPSNEVHTLEWRDEYLVEESLPPLPVPLIGPGVGCFEDQSVRQIYVFGGADVAGCGQGLDSIIPLGFFGGQASGVGNPATPSR